jgi:GntR family transcriptional regulator
VTVPMYRVIAEELRGQIESGEVTPGQQLPTELDLRERFGASRNTVRDAVKWLITLGLVETRPGQGTFVVRKIDPFVTTLTADPRPAGRKVTAPGAHGYGEIDRYQGTGEEQRRMLTVSEPQVEIQKASDDIAAWLDVPPGSQVVSRHQRRYIDGTPWSLQTSFYPMRLVRTGADRLIEASDIADGTLQYLADSLGLGQVGYRTQVSVRTPDATEAYFFNLPQDGRVGVFEIAETGFDQTGQPMRVTMTIFPTDRNQFVVSVGNVPDQLPDDSKA